MTREKKVKEQEKRVGMGKGVVVSEVQAEAVSCKSKL